MANGQFVCRIFKTGLALAFALALAACSGGGHTRGIFQGYVIGKTEAEIVEKVGKPDNIERKGADATRLVFNKKTFNPDDSNREDQQTIVVLSRDANGKLIASDVEYL